MKILVAEEDRKLASNLRKLLADAGYAADTCADGTEALRQLETQDFALAILGVNLAGVEGLEVCRRLRRGGRHLPLFMTSSRDDVNQRVLAFNTGADDFLVKPFEGVELVARVQALLRRAAGQLQLAIGALEIDIVRHAAKLGGAPLPLTAREFSLLLHLAQRSEELVTRGELLSQVWSSQFESESNIVDVQISRLRTKLGDHAWMIETLRGRGYRMRAER